MSKDSDDTSKCECACTLSNTRCKYDENHLNPYTKLSNVDLIIRYNLMLNEIKRRQKEVETKWLDEKCEKAVAVNFLQSSQSSCASEVNEIPQYEVLVQAMTSTNQPNYSNVRVKEEINIDDDDNDSVFSRETLLLDEEHNFDIKPSVEDLQARLRDFGGSQETDNDAVTETQEAVAGGTQKSNENRMKTNQKNENVSIRHADQMKEHDIDRPNDKPDEEENVRSPLIAKRRDSQSQSNEKLKIVEKSAGTEKSYAENEASQLAKESHSQYKNEIDSKPNFFTQFKATEDDLIAHIDEALKNFQHIGSFGETFDMPDDVQRDEGTTKEMSGIKMELCIESEYDGRRFGFDLHEMNKKSSNGQQNVNDVHDNGQRNSLESNERRRRDELCGKVTNERSVNQPANNQRSSDTGNNERENVEEKLCSLETPTKVIRYDEGIARANTAAANSMDGMNKCVVDKPQTQLQSSSHCETPAPLVIDESGSPANIISLKSPTPTGCRSSLMNSIRVNRRLKITFERVVQRNEARGSSYLDDIDDEARTLNTNAKICFGTKHCRICKLKIKGRPAMHAKHYLLHHRKSEVCSARLSQQNANMAKVNMPFTRLFNGHYDMFCVFCNETHNKTYANWCIHYSNCTGEFCGFCFKCNKKVTGNEHCGLKYPNTPVLKPSAKKDIDAYVCNLCNYLQLDAAKLIKHLLREHKIEGPLVDKYAKIVLLQWKPNNVAETMALVSAPADTPRENRFYENFELWQQPLQSTSQAAEAPNKNQYSGHRNM